MALMIACPTCGRRPYTEFWWGGELPEETGGSSDLEVDYRRTWLRRNLAGLQSERWFHHAGCRRWVTVVRDTVTNEIHGVV